MLASVVVSVALDQLFVGEISPVLFLWPPFAFYRCLSQMNANSYLRSRRPYTISMLAPPDQVGVAVIFMLIEIPIWLLLAAYLNSVIPSEYGVPKKWYFPCVDVFNFCTGKNRKKKKSVEAEADGSSAVAAVSTSTDFSHPIETDSNGYPVLHHELTAAELETPGMPEEDADVKAERTRVLLHQFDAARTPLLLVGMRKVYPSRGGKGPKVAVKDVTLAIEEGVIFGLLGPNGAGELFAKVLGLSLKPANSLFVAIQARPRSSISSPDCTRLPMVLPGLPGTTSRPIWIRCTKISASARNTTFFGTT